MGAAFLLVKSVGKLLEEAGATKHAQTTCLARPWSGACRLLGYRRTWRTG